MNYNSLFNFLYSTEISEATKSSIIDRIQEPVLESCEAEPLVETYLELLDTLVYSTASEALIYNIIDETFSPLSEEAINEVSNEWVKRKVEDSMKARRSAADAANKSVKSGVIGLSQLNRQAKANAELAKGEAKASRIMNKAAVRSGKTPAATDTSNTGVLGKLKSAVGKVKSWVGSKSPMPKEHDHVGLGRLVAAKANKDNVGAETLRQQTTQKGEAPAENKAASSAPKKTKKVEAENKSTEVKNKAPKAEQQKLALEAPSAKTENKPSKASVTTKVTKKNSKKTEEVRQPEVQAEAPKAEAENKPAKVEKPKSTKETARKGKIGLLQNIAKSKAKGETAAQEEKPKEIKAETSKPAVENKSSEEPKIKVDMNKKDPETEKADKKFANSMAREAKRIRADQEKQLGVLRQRRQEMTSKPGYDQKSVEDLDSRIADLEKKLNVTANEALSSLAILLTHTNISESCFVEVMEMAGANKANADKVKKRLEKETDAAMDDLYKDVEKGKSENPRKVEKLDKLTKRVEKFNSIYKKKFNNSN